MSRYKIKEKSMSDNDSIKKAIDGMSKDLPRLVKENKGAAVGAVVGYLLADKLADNNEITSAILGGLVGAVIDERSQE